MHVCPLYTYENINFLSAIFSSSGHRWKALRTNTLKALRYFGVGHQSYREKIKVEIEYFIRGVKQHKGEAFDPSDLCSISISNVICSIVFGRRYEHTDDDLLHLVQSFHEIFRLNGLVTIVNLFPLLRFFPGDFFGIRRLMTLMNNVLEFISVHVKDHQLSLDRDNPRDYIDTLLLHASDKKESKGVLTGLFCTATNSYFKGYM